MTTEHDARIKALEARLFGAEQQEHIAAVEEREEQQAGGEAAVVEGGLLPIAQ